MRAMGPAVLLVLSIAASQLPAGPAAGDDRPPVAGTAEPAAKATEGAGGAGGGEASALACENPASRVRWQIEIDSGRRTADSFPARIDARRIEWRDTVRGGTYRFDRRSGILTVVYASSTGGFSVKDRCRLVP